MAKKKMTRFQNLYIKFANGIEVHASVVPFAETQEEADELEIEKFVVTPPKDLPEGVSFEYIDPGEEKKDASVDSDKSS